MVTMDTERAALIETIRDILADEVGDVSRADALAEQIVREVEQALDPDDPRRHDGDHG
jgi:tetrahydromethanopterin S-methyltransferase subunit B